MAIKASATISLTRIDDGTGVASITTEFYLSTSKTTQTGGSWVTTMPTWVRGKYLWTRNKVVYKNPAKTSYTTPVCDSSWEAANDAAKTATNFMGFDSTNGLQIGNKSGGKWTGFRSRIGSSSFDILDTAGAIVASYGSKIVELGKNATDAIIKLCGDRGHLKYDSSENYMELCGTNVRVKGESQAAIYTFKQVGTAGMKKSSVIASTDQVHIFSSDLPDGAISAVDSEIILGGGSAQVRTEKQLQMIGGEGVDVQTVFGDIGLNGPITSNRNLKVLWSGTYYMTAGHTINLKEPVSKQLNGIVLVWGFYQNGAAVNSRYNYIFVPKFHVEQLAGYGVNCNLCGLWDCAMKYVYVHDTKITGHEKNNQEGVIGGITYHNNHYVLRYVLGV